MLGAAMDSPPPHLIFKIYVSSDFVLTHRGHLAMARDILIVMTREMLLTSNVQRPGILQIILQCTSESLPLVAKVV